MKFLPTKFDSAWLIEADRHEDERGFFARTWCQREFKEYGLNPDLVQCNISYNSKQGTLRGMHFQTAPYEEAKLIRCTTGSIYDVIVDLRPHSPTYMNWQGFELSAENRSILYVPEGAAHGFVTLEPTSEVFYQMSRVYEPEASSGFLWKDEKIAIDWKYPVKIVSDRDSNLPSFNTLIQSAA